MLYLYPPSLFIQFFHQSIYTHYLLDPVIPEPFPLFFIHKLRVNPCKVDSYYLRGDKGTHSQTPFHKSATPFQALSFSYCYTDTTYSISGLLIILHLCLSLGKQLKSSSLSTIPFEPLHVPYLFIFIKQGLKSRYRGVGTHQRQRKREEG